MKMSNTMYQELVQRSPPCFAMTGHGHGKGDFSDALQVGVAAEDAAEDVVSAAEFAAA